MIEKIIVGFVGGVILFLVGAALVGFGLYAVDRWGGWGLLVYLAICGGLAGICANVKEDKR